MAGRKIPTVAAARAASQAVGAGRRSSGDGGRPFGMNGARRGISGLRKTAGVRLARADPRDLVSGWMVVMAVGLVVTVVNALTALADNPGIRTWEAWVWEGSSMAAAALLLWIPWLTAAVAPPDEAAGSGWRSRAWIAGVHLVGLMAYATLHVGGFVLLRRWAYALVGDGAYEFGDRFIYELRKDLLSYTLFVGVFWLAAYQRRRSREPVRPVSFDIRDGARLIRTPLSEIVTISSAGNYVEFHLADGRRPLMRATLAAVEVELERFGFVRAHRSWLVNVERVTGLRPEGSGDWTVELGEVEAPLSRRYPHALEQLRSGRFGPGPDVVGATRRA